MHRYALLVDEIQTSASRFWVEACAHSVFPAEACSRAIQASVAQHLDRGDFRRAAVALACAAQLTLHVDAKLLERCTDAAGRCANLTLRGLYWAVCRRLLGNARG